METLLSMLNSLIAVRGPSSPSAEQTRRCPLPPGEQCTQPYQLIWAGVQSRKNHILLAPSSLSCDLLCVNKLCQEPRGARCLSAGRLEPGGGGEVGSRGLRPRCPAGTGVLRGAGIPCWTLTPRSALCSASWWLLLMDPRCVGSLTAVSASGFGMW